jgi:serine/threonine-protein kinase
VVVREADTLPPPPGYDRGLVAGKYRLTQQIGRGGMGTVWEGVHDTLGTRVAVKIIEIEHVQSPESLRRFENEAHAAARLQSKHVVEVYDHGVMPDGRAFIVMQYLQGEPLDRRLERLGRLSPRETARIVLQICRALSKAHAIGIVHRDLKPENIFLVWDEEDGADVVKVVDFGIAKFTAPTGQVAGTYTGSLLGTPFYMSPEQARGLRTVDHRSDLWSVGVITFRCMVGRLPFEGDSVGDVLVKLCTGPIPAPSELVPDLPAGFDSWMARVLTREPLARFSSAAELGEALGAVCGVPVRPAYSTGDIPIHGSDSSALEPAGPIITPTYSSNPLPSDATLASRPIGAARATPDVTIGGGVANTPAQPGRRSKSSLVAMLAVALVGLGVSAVALVKSRPSKGTATAGEAPVHHAPPPAAATAANPLPIVAPPAARSADTEKSPTDSPPEAAPSVSATPSASARPQVKAPKRKPAAASSNKAAPSLDIRLER